MSDDNSPQLGQSGNENWKLRLFDLYSSVPGQALEDAPSLPRGGSARRYVDYRALEGRDIIDYLVTSGVPVGAHDETTADWAARNLDVATLLTLLSWVRRASASGST